MARKRRKRKGKRRAQSSVLRREAVLQQAEELLASGKPSEALQLLDRNAARLQKDFRFHALRASALSDLGKFAKAALAATQARELAPDDPEVVLIASTTLMAAGYHSLAAEARRQWFRMVSPQHPAYAMQQRLEEEYRAAGELLRVLYEAPDVETVERAGLELDRGRWALSTGRWKEALQHSRAAAEMLPRWAAPRNNASMALFYLGRPAEAIAEAEKVLELDADNVPALANLIRFHYALGRQGEVEYYTERLAAQPLAAESGHVIRQLEGLTVGGRFKEVLRLLPQAQRRYEDLHPLVELYAGIAAANLKRWKEAARHLQRAQELGLEHPLLEPTLLAVLQRRPGPGQMDHYPALHYTELAPEEAPLAASRIFEREHRRGQRDEEAWAEFLKRFPQAVAVAKQILYLHSEPNLVEAAIEWLVSLRTPEAVEVLREFALGQRGTEEARMRALESLQQLGVIEPDAEVEVWVGGERRQVRVQHIEVTEDIPRPDYPPAAWKAYEKAVAAHHAGNYKKAEREYQRMLKHAPNAKEAYNNLAVLYSAQGKHKEAEECLDRALEIDPLYSYPRVARALNALAQNDVDAAEAWLQPLTQRTRWHPVEYAYYLKALARVAIAKEEYDSAASSLKLVTELKPDDEEAKELLRWLEEVKSFLELGDLLQARMRETTERYRRRRQRKSVPADPTLQDALNTLTKGDLVGIGYVLDIQGISGLKKAELQAYFHELLQDRRLLKRVVGELREEERAALRDVLAHGGVMDWHAFAERHGHDLEESPYLEYHAAEMETVMGRLRARALLYEGTAEGRLIIFIPQEMREPLRKILGT